MTRNVTPMIHVPDVRATAVWYRDVGFTLLATHPDEGELDWALLAFGDGRVMLNTGGRPSDAVRREVDLYVHTDELAALAGRLRPRVEVIEDGFWLTFGEDLSPA